MMLRSLVDEVVRRRLWPIPLAALLVAIAAPLLFMKSAPTSAPAPTPVPEQVSLPRAADDLMKSTDKPRAAKRRLQRRATDPFAAPSKAATASAAAAGGSGSTGSAQAVPITITNSDGSTTSATIAPSSGSSKSTGSSTKSKPKAKAKPAAKKPATTKIPTVTSSSSAAATQKVTYVDVRFGERMGTMTRYRVPRFQTFRAGGKVAAMFIRYSAVRNAAVFAIAPSTKVSGVSCRKVKKVCRYVDVPVGGHARLSLVGRDGLVVSRRIDVVRVRHMPKIAGSTASARMTTLPAAKCLLQSLLSLSATAPSISTDSCE
jgi:hypothetical protein